MSDNRHPDMPRVVPMPAPPADEPGVVILSIGGQVLRVKVDVTAEDITDAPCARVLPIGEAAKRAAEPKSKSAARKPSKAK